MPIYQNDGGGMIKSWEWMGEYITLYTHLLSPSNFPTPPSTKQQFILINTVEELEGCKRGEYWYKIPLIHNMI